MTKTTKLVRGIHSWIKFQKHQGVESLSIEGKQALADLSQDKNGDTNLILNADKDKVNTVTSSVPFLAIAHTTTGTDPNQEKTATISHDLTQFNLGSDGLIDVSKTEASITLYTTKITEKINEVVNSAVTTKETEIKDYVNTTLSTKEEALKDFVRDQTAGAVGVSPTYVADEIRKAKEELTAEINAHAGSGSTNQDLHLVHWANGSSSGHNSAKYAVHGVSNRVLISVSISYYVDNKTVIEHLFVPSGQVTDYVKNGIGIKCSNASDGNDLTITLPVKTDSFQVDLITYAYPFGGFTDVNADVTPDPSYTPVRENTAPVPQ